MLKPFIELTNDDLARLKLISKSKNKPYNPIYKEELPKILYNRAPRKLLGKTWFDRYTSNLNLVKICQGCNKPLSGLGERHEVYGLYEIDLGSGKEYLIKLEYVMKLCNRCHGAIHYGFTTKIGMNYGFVPDSAPESTAMTTGPWSKARYLLVSNNLYKLV